MWIAKIMGEIAQNSQRAVDIGLRLYEPHSRRRESMETSLQADGYLSSYVDPNAPPKQMGYQAPEQQGAVASEALRAFLGLELPVALNFTNGWGRSEHRTSAVYAAFRPCRHYGMADKFDLCWMFNGYQLYASHHIGAAHSFPWLSDVMGHIERRLLNGHWVRCSFDGTLPPPAGRRWSSNKRTFMLAASGIKRIGRTDSDLVPQYDDLEDEGDADEDANPYSLGAT